jgi:hypothetical protein
MRLRKAHIPYFLAVVAIFLSFELNNGQPERPTTGYWAMEGTLMNHPFMDHLDSLSGNEIFELQDENGLTLWFGRHIFKDVCISGICRMIKLWLFWDGAGNYLDIQLFENEPLTKSDHTDFEPDDYVKLNGILNDPNSVLKDYSSEDLTIEKVPDNPFEVDGYTSATQPTLAEVVVKDAVYTCHTLWHTVFGSTRTMILDILDKRVSHDYLALMFESQFPAYVVWAIGIVERLPEYHEDFYPLIIENIKSEDASLSQQALNYFQSHMLNDEALQKQLAAVIPELTTQKKYDIIWKFVDLEKTNVDVVLTLLEMFQQQEIGVGAINLIYRLVLPEHLTDNQRIREIVQELSAHENAYIRNLTGRLLNGNN